MTRYRRRLIMGNNEKSGWEEIMLPDYERFFTLCREVCTPVRKVSWVFSGSETGKSSMT